MGRKLTTINNFVGNIKAESSQSFLSKLFQILIQINLVPLKWEKGTNELSFKYLSMPFAVYLLYGIVISIFCVFSWYMFGFSNWIQAITNIINNFNATDQITFFGFNAFSLSQLNLYPTFCKNFTKISKDIIWVKKLDWPKYGTKFLILLCLNFLAMNGWFYLTISKLIEVQFESFMWFFFGNFNTYLFSAILNFISIIYILSWMDLFSRSTKYLDSSNIHQYSKNCLNVFHSLQNGLGIPILINFSLSQVMNILCLYMAISSAFFGQYDILSNISLSICYLLMALYNLMILYSVTLTAEEAYENLQSLVRPLEQLLLLTQNSEENMKVKLLIKEIERTPPLSGNGYFELKRGTITSIISTSVTYLIILLQFRTSGSK